MTSPRKGSAVDVGRYHAPADRVFRAGGNPAGRGRLDSGAKLRGAKPPRAFILSTGEDVPRSQSIRPRLLILELSNGAIKSSQLTECQRDATAPGLRVGRCRAHPLGTDLCLLGRSDGRS